jgi:hypothetical protein
MRRAGVATALLFVGCAGWPPGVPRVPDCRGSLADTAALPGGDFLLRERARVEAGEIAVGLELTIERRGARLVVVAFDPFGAAVFTAVQTDGALELDDRLGRIASIDPETLLADLHAGPLRSSGAHEREVVVRPGCHHTTTFVRIERRSLSD